MSNSTPIPARIVKAFSRSGIDLRREHGVYHVRNERAQASILLPDGLPLEEKAVSQLLAFAAVASPEGQALVCRACATPDFHPGSIAPVGSVVATPDDVVIPAAIGTDINCGMRLLTTGLTLGQLAPTQSKLVQRLKSVLLENERNVPVNTVAFRALFDDGPQAFVAELVREGLWADADLDRIAHETQRCIGLESLTASARHAAPAFIADRTTYRDPCLGTPGGGNHFVELQVVSEVLDRHVAYEHGIRVGEVVVMIHSGSRDFGFYVGGRWMDRAKAQWPTGLKHPASQLYALQGSLARDYLQAMGTAARYAWANRVVLAELVRKELASLMGADGSRLVVDVPHNVVLPEHGLNIHRKGSTPAHLGDLALILVPWAPSPILPKAWAIPTGCGLAAMVRAEASAAKPPVPCDPVPPAA